MSRKHRVGKSVTTISATIPHALMDQVRRYCDLYKVNASRLVLEGLEWRLGQRDAASTEEPRYGMVAEVGQQSAQLDAQREILTAHKETLEAMERTFRADLEAYEAHIHAMTASITEHEGTLENHTALFQQKGEILDDILT